jgi:hypothetical protein
VLLSRSHCLLALFLVSSTFQPQLARADAATRSARAAPAAASIDRAWMAQLNRRVERLLPVVMASLAAARRAHDPLLIRCFDRTVSALHGAGRQLRFHSERWENETSASERRRHEMALRVLSARVDELARMPALCFTGGVPVASDQTYVEVVKPRD